MDATQIGFAPALASALVHSLWQDTLLVFVFLRPFSAGRTAAFRSPGHPE